MPSVVFGVDSQIQGLESADGKVRRNVGGEELTAEDYHLLDIPYLITGFRLNLKTQGLDKRCSN